MVSSEAGVIVRYLERRTRHAQLFAVPINPVRRKIYSLGSCYASETWHLACRQHAWAIRVILLQNRLYKRSWSFDNTTVLVKSPEINSHL